MPDDYSENTTVFEFPVKYDNPRSIEHVSAWEQFALLAMLQREWSDNMVSCTISFDEEREGPQVEHMLAMFAPVIKSEGEEHARNRLERFRRKRRGGGGVLLDSGVQYIAALHPAVTSTLSCRYPDV